MKSLPSGPWEVLFQRALRLVADIQRHGVFSQWLHSPSGSREFSLAA